ncbi:MAG: glutamine synthetase III [Flavobacteriales bacterium]
MATFRFDAMENVIDRKPNHVAPPANKISEYYNSKVFDDYSMREHLPDDAYIHVKDAIQKGKRIDRKIADQVASSMKEWAISLGATHYTHWFQPLTGLTAEKHDAFFEPLQNGGAMEKFDGEELVQQEPDASSLPSGGIRNTFEARGYTAWDPTSPAFVIEKTLCIPTIFVSYTGEALDNKMPLLKAIKAVNDSAVEVCKYFDKKVKSVNPTLGWEQEYFLVDTAFYNARPDIIMSGRALFGHEPAKGQQLSDHYFGSIAERASAFMRDFENEALKLGIPVKTRHNEVAPNQFECAPVFEDVNFSNDHNLLLMTLLEKVSRKHDFRVLLHEKPFQGLNGSGKHNNWSLITDTGKNLLKPGKTPKENLSFLCFFVNTIKAIYEYSDILRGSIASAGNEHRLGANEAPPAILSIFIGSHLTQVLDNLEKSIKKGKMTPEEKTVLKLNIGKIPQLLLDNTDRNRTSPFAFTGNKFEFRAVGSSANCASAMTALNTIMAKQLKDFKTEVDKKIKQGIKKDEAILKILRKYIVESKNIRFEGNGYSEEWVKEAKKRGLSNIKDTPSALDVMVSDKAKKVFTEMDVLSEVELDARRKTELENYTLKLQIESRMAGDIAQNHIIPIAFKYLNRLLDNVNGMNEAFGKSEAQNMIKPQRKTIKDISKHLEKLKENVDEMLEKRKKANKIEDEGEIAKAYNGEVKPYLDKIKYHSDKLELLIDDDLWPLPKLREILFTR